MATKRDEDMISRCETLLTDFEAAKTVIPTLVLKDFLALLQWQELERLTATLQNDSAFNKGN